MERFFYTLGYALGTAESRIEALVSATDGVDDGPTDAPPTAERATAPRAAPHLVEDDGGDDDVAGAAVGTALGATAAGWVLSRLLRPHPIHWPRAILAGIVGTALADAVRLLEPREAGTPPPLPPRAEDLPRYAAGVATAAAYASLLYPRLPGAPVTRGLLFGALEAAAAREGGAFGFLRRIAPQVAIPLESLAEGATPRRGGPLADLAFGLGLGLYSRGEDDET